MKKIWAIILILVVAQAVPAQKIFWSDLTREDVLQAVETGQIFFSDLQMGKRDSLKYFISEDSIYVGAHRWIDRDLFLDMATERAEKISFQNMQLTGYRFDDFLDNYDQNEILEKVYPVFDNHSVLILMNYQFNRSMEQALLVLKKNDSQWTISGFHGLGLYPENTSVQELSRHEFRMEKIGEAGIVIPIPIDFSDADRLEDQVNFYLPGETERDAVIQVLIDELKAKVYYYIYKFVEFSNQQYELSDLVVRYLPFGILFEYTVMDSNGSKNKGITVGLESENKMVVIQLYAFYDVFQRREEEFLKVFNYLER